MNGHCDRVFEPDSMIWKVCRERVNLLHGPAAAVLQVAHPRIGLGVMQHSGFADDPTSRLHRTLDAVYTIAFGTRQEADSAARKIARRHANVIGDARVHNIPGPADYSAAEIDLLMWVVATLVWSALGGYERCVGELTLGERERFYSDMRILGTFFDLPTTYGPQTWREFEVYFGDQIARELMGSHPVSRRVAQAVARPMNPWWLRLATRPIGFIFSEILPPPVRDRLGFRSTRASRLSLWIATWWLRLFVRFAPPRLRFAPHYLAARRSVRPPPRVELEFSLK